MTFKKWQKECLEQAKALLSLGDILNRNDPYDLFTVMRIAWKSGQSPEDFIREIFADDLAQQEHDDQLRLDGDTYEHEFEVNEA